MNRQQLAKKVRSATDSLIREKGYVSAVEMFMKIERLSKVNVEGWRMRKVPYLERVIELNLNQISFAMKEFRNYCESRGFKPSWTAYHSWGKKKPKVRLQFSKSGNPNMEKSYATHFVLKKNKSEE